MIETQLAIALTKLLILCQNKMQQNPYTIPEVKASYFALAKLTKYSGDWMNMDLQKILFQLESRL